MLEISHQSLDCGAGELMGFEFSRIEADLRDSLLPSARPILIATHEFTFKGEVVLTGAMEKLGQKIKQIDLPPSILDQVMINCFF